MNRKILLWFDVEDYVTPESEEALFRLLKKSPLCLPNSRL